MLRVWFLMIAAVADECAYDDTALAVAREFVDELDECVDEDAYGAFRAAAGSAAGVEKATALAIVLLVIEHGAAPFDDPEVVALCRSLDRAGRESLVASLEEYFGDFYETAAVELGSLRYALEEEPEDVDLWVDIVFFLVVFGVACGLSALLRRLFKFAVKDAKPVKKRRKKHKKPQLVVSSDSEPEPVIQEEPPEPPKPPPPTLTTVFSVKVVPLPPDVQDDDLRRTFARYGGVVGARVFGHASPPHGYVDFECRADAVAAAFHAHGSFLVGDAVQVACIVRERTLSSDSTSDFLVAPLATTTRRLGLPLKVQ